MLFQESMWAAPGYDLKINMLHQAFYLQDVKSFWNSVNGS